MDLAVVVRAEVVEEGKKPAEQSWMKAVGAEWSWLCPQSSLWQRETPPGACGHAAVDAHFALPKPKGEHSYYNYNNSGIIRIFDLKNKTKKPQNILS